MSYSKTNFVVFLVLCNKAYFYIHYNLVSSTDSIIIAQRKLRNSFYFEICSCNQNLIFILLFNLLHFLYKTSYWLRALTIITSTNYMWMTRCLKYINIYSYLVSFNGIFHHIILHRYYFYFNYRQSYAGQGDQVPYKKHLTM